MAVEIAPATPLVDFQNFDFGDSNLERLLTLEAQPDNPQDETPGDLTLVDMKDLLEVVVSTVETERVPPPFDLTGIDLEILQDLAFGTDPQDTADLFRQMASLDIESPLDQDGVNDVVLMDRTTEPGDFGGKPILPPQAKTNDVDAAAGARLPLEPANQPPSVLDDLLKTPQDTGVAGNVLANDHDADGGLLTVTNAGILLSASTGTVDLSADGSFTYMPPAGYSGYDTFDYTASDGQGGTASATAEIKVIKTNLAPSAIDDSVATSEDTPVIVDALANDSDPDGDPLTIDSVVQGSSGAVTVNTDGTLTYTPDPDFHGTDSFTHTVSDPYGGCDTATVTVTVTPVNDAPVAIDDAFTGVEDAAITGTVLANDSDVDGDTLTVASTGLLATAEGGTVVMAADGRFTYTPAAAFVGTDSFIYDITDGNGGTATAAVNVDVTINNADPIATDDSYVTPKDSLVSGNVLDNDSDPDGDMLTVSDAGVRTTLQGGTAVLEADGTFDFKPMDGFTGTDNFTYSIGDGRGGMASATVTFALAAPGAILNGTDGDDRLVGTPGIDTLDGKGGNDVLIGLAGADSLEGGIGIDTVSYRDSDARIEVSLVSGDGLGGHAEGDVLSGIENLDGSVYDDYLRGDAGDNVLRGGPGDDELLGFVGNDLLVGGPGADRLAGGDGIDTADYRNSDAAVIIDLDTDMGAGGHAEGDFLEKIENVYGSRFADVFIGDFSDNTIRGGRGNDEMSGGSGDDHLFGGPGNDILEGEFGDDVLNGGLGDDWLIGDTGIETFVFDSGSGTDNDSIENFVSLQDVIDLQSFGLTDMSDLTIASDGAGGSLIDLPSGDSIEVLLVDPASLTAGDFIF